ncbi:MAG: penicillin-binding transpeptidase domain-containing protein, partial [Lentisphaeria bacterium]
SIMKPFTASLAIENRAVQINSKVFCENGRWYYGGRPLRDTHGHGDLTVAEILQKSSNIGAAKLAVKIGEQKLYDGLHEFGFGQRSRLGFLNSAQKELSFIGETPGMFKNVRSWDKVTVTRMAIGQGLTVTVLQLAQAWGALANHGTMMHLYLVDRVVYANNEMQCSVPQEMSQPVSPETADAVTQALKLVTQKGGTGGRAAVPGYYVAGKTGTGQQWVSADKSKGIRGHYSNYDYFSSFIGYVPADNPEFVLLVCADRPKAKYARLNNGGYVSAPTFREIARRTLEYLRVPKDYDPDMHDKKLTPTYYRRNTTASQ